MKKTFYRVLSQAEETFIESKLTQDITCDDALIAHALRDEGFCKDLPMKVIRNKVRYYRKKVENSSENSTPAVGKIVQQGQEQTQKNKTFTGLVSVNPGDNVDPAWVMKQYGLDPRLWVVDKFTLNNWESQTKGGGSLLLKQFKLTVSPLRGDNISMEMVKESFEALMENRKTIAKQETGIWKNTICKNLRNQGIDSSVINMLKKTLDCPAGLIQDEKGDGYTVTITISDLHLGLRATSDETDKEVNLEIVVNALMGAVDSLRNKLILSGRKFNKIIIATNGDFLHVDNNNGTTTAGTPQQVDGSIYGIYETGVKLMDTIIQKFTALAPVEYIYIPGNHDRVTGQCLAYTVARAYLNDPNVTVDYSPKPHKFRQCGQNLIGWTHGDTSPKNLDALMSNYAPREEFNSTTFRFLHVGHLHNVNAHVGLDKTYVEMMTSVNPGASRWEYQKGFPVEETPCLLALLWDKDGHYPDRLVAPVK